MHPVGLFKVGGHLGQQAVGRNADVDREAQLPAHAAADRVRGGQRRAEQCLGAGHVEKRLVDAVLFNIRGVIVQNLNQCLAVFYIKIKVRRHDGQPRALDAGGKEALPRLDAEFFRRGAFCQHNAVALGLIAADDGRDRAQIDSAAALQRLERRPGQKRRVDVHMEVDFGHGDLLSALAFPLGGRWPRRAG